MPAGNLAIDGWKNQALRDFVSGRFSALAFGCSSEANGVGSNWPIFPVGMPPVLTGMLFGL